MHDYDIYHQIMAGNAVHWWMDPANPKRILIKPFDDDHPDPFIGDVVYTHFSQGLHASNVVEMRASDGVVWYRMMDGTHDQWVRRNHVVGYVSES